LRTFSTPAEEAEERRLRAQGVGAQIKSTTVEGNKPKDRRDEGRPEATTKKPTEREQFGAREGDTDPTLEHGSEASGEGGEGEGGD
jgi:hypothetical protein